MFLLCIAFLYAIIMSYLHIQRDSTFEESIEYNQGTLPSITFCRIQGSKTHYQTFEDVVAALNEFESRINANVYFYDETKVNLMNSSTTESYYNVSYDDIWSFGVTVNENSPYALQPCATLNLGFLKKPEKKGDVKVGLIVFTNSPLTIEKHEPRQSLYHHRFNWLEGMETYEKNFGYQEYFIPTVTTSLNKYDYQCDEKNQIKKTECIDEFLTRQLNCSLPWIKTIKANIIKCTGDLTMLRELYNETRFIQSPKIVHDLQKCLIPNCVTTKWTKSHAAKWPLKELKYEQVKLIWKLPPNAYTLYRREIFLANPSTFFADIGSYLGLFLGASILSLTDVILTNCKAILVRAYERCRPQRQSSIYQAQSL